MKSLFLLNKLTTPIVILALGAGSSLTSTQAYADHKHRQKQNYSQGQNQWDDQWNKQSYSYQNNRRVAPQRHYRKKNRTGELIAVGILGLAVGALLVDSANKRKHAKQNYSDSSNNNFNNSYQRSYIPENSPYILPKGSEEYNKEDVITYEESASLEPCTPGWQEYCSQRYRSFNPQSGTYKGYDGLHHFCVAK